MATLVNEQKFLENTVFIYEKKLKSPINKFLDSTPTTVRYYHINPDVTTTDGGFMDVESLLGSHSPLRFNRIDNFPIYLPEAVQLQLQDTEQGLDSSYEGEGTILPGTIKPLQNDYFTINTIKGPFLFRVTEITYDAAMADGFYKIGFKLENIDSDEIEKLEKQVCANFTYFQRSMGSEERCIIENEYVDEVSKIEKMYYDIADTYKSIFYNERYNCFLGELGPNQRLYDPLMTDFINKHHLFNRKDSYDVLLLSDHYPSDNHRAIKYEKSVYRFLERRDHTLIKNFKFDVFVGASLPASAFARWHDDSVFIADIPAVPTNNGISIFLDSFIAAVKYNTPIDSSEHADLLIRFIRNEDIPINSIPLNLNEELLHMETSLEVFFVTPMILYILRTVLEEFMNERKFGNESIKLTK